eukprot:CAMPEP_0180814954 /NCGR_PEP_ID=MMETSP1038_2-20121128/67347_1 /TAXON_ID=632150 /ORGANISM="Azadinium spinosum, Strain 3D9" /LENGTH=49 /DNA_ID= /DNA_START= /DNA_END= /DNA_ORIENTATION=
MSAALLPDRTAAASTTTGATGSLTASPSSSSMALVKQDPSVAIRCPRSL